MPTAYDIFQEILRKSFHEALGIGDILVASALVGDRGP